MQGSYINTFTIVTLDPDRGDENHCMPICSVFEKMCEDFRIHPDKITNTAYEHSFNKFNFYLYFPISKSLYRCLKKEL